VNSDEVRTLVRMLEARSKTGVEMLPGTLQDVSLGQGAVVLDGTTSEVGVNVIAECEAGDRVMVLFVPPRGGFVIGRIGAPEAKPGWNILYSSVASLTGAQSIQVPGFAQGWEDFQLRVTGQSSEVTQQWVRFNGQSGNDTLHGTMIAINANATLTNVQEFSGLTTFRISEWGTPAGQSAIVDMQRVGSLMTIMVESTRLAGIATNSRRIVSSGQYNLGQNSVFSVQLSQVAGTPTWATIKLYGLNPE